jgi:hypothetical protein
VPAPTSTPDSPISAGSSPTESSTGQPPENLAAASTATSGRVRAVPGAAAAAARDKAAAARRGQARKARHRKLALLFGSVTAVLVVIAGFVILDVTHQSSSTVTARRPAPAAVVRAVTTVPVATFTAVGQGKGASAATKQSGPVLTVNGKPDVLYVGGEFCPYCATERWPLAVALSRFGTFTNLGVIKSSATDAYPNTATLDFYKSTYTSDYLTFTPKEIFTNVPQGSGYGPLDTLTAAQTATMAKLDPSGGIPFISYAGSYLGGVQYDPKDLAGLTAAQIAGKLTTVSSTDTVGQAVIGSANLLTGVLCNLTGDKPATVCKTPLVANMQALLAQANTAAAK